MRERNAACFQPVLNCVGLLLAAQFCGCAYRLPPVVPPHDYMIRVVSNSPERYALRLRFTDLRQYNVAPDGHVVLPAPAYRAGCSVYLFDKIRISSGGHPFSEKRVELLVGGRVVRQFSLKDIAALPLGADQYHELTPPGQHASLR